MDTVIIPHRAADPPMQVVREHRAARSVRVTQEEQKGCWQAIQDDFRNFLRSEECLELGQSVASLP